MMSLFLNDMSLIKRDKLLYMDFCKNLKIKIYVTCH